MKIILPAAIVSLVAATSAWAQPPASPLPGLSPLGLTQVAERDRDNDRHRYTPGRRYDKTPSGWHRHGSRRPGDWRTRGCILVGPVWFCP